MRNGPVIKYEYFSRGTRFMLFTAYSMGLLFAGFLIGLVIGVMGPPPQPIILMEKPLVVPEYQLPAPKPLPPSFIEDGPDKGGIKSAWNPKDYAAETKCLAQNMYFEGRSESTTGRIAIGHATINRVLNPRFPDTICDVVWQKAKDRRSGEYVAQFSWTLDGKKDIPANKEAWEELLRIAEAMTAEGSLHNFVDVTNGATQYHANYVSPYWIKATAKSVPAGGEYFARVATIGTHIFYRSSRDLHVEYRAVASL